MSSKKTPMPTIKSSDDGSQTYTINPTTLPPTMRGLPVYLTPDFVLYPGDTAVVTLMGGEEDKIFETAIHESHELVIAYKTGDKGGKAKKDFPPHLPVATIALVMKAEKGPDGEMRYSIRGTKRVLLEATTRDEETNIWRTTTSDANEIPLPTIGAQLFEAQGKMRVIRQLSRQIFERIQTPAAKDLLRALDRDTLDPGTMCDRIARTLDVPCKDRAAILNHLNIFERLEHTLHLLTEQIQIAQLMAEIAQNVRAEMEKQQRDYYLRQQIKALQEQVGDKTDQNNDLDELKAQIEKLEASDEVKEYCMKEWKRMTQMQTSGSEYSVARAHLETLLDIPWSQHTTDSHDIAEARRILDEDHFGLTEVKARLVEFLAVRALKPDLKAPILCLYGPPGVGKTSLGQSVARALGRKFHRISLGGVHDESEIRGHRRTYVASMPGRIVQALRKVKTMNPVIMLDEVDKLANDMRGDPSSALLEVLDPEQNFAFSDNYVELPIDLSQVLFITTANSLDTIPPALRDRMEIIEIPGYTTVDKHHIAVEHLIPKLLDNHGLVKSNLEIKNDALEEVISRYTHEAGVRQLEQRLSAIMRKVATTVAEAKNDNKRAKKTTVSAKTITNFLGKPRYDHDKAQKHPVTGVATGLAWTSCGGEILMIETTVVPGKGKIVMTGKLGDVMQESITTALTVLRSRAEKLGLAPDFLENKDVHVHFPAAATPKDGPSAGCAIFTALMSLFTDQLVPADIAMTGEISLRGLALPIGGLREKVLGAYRAGIKTVLFPKENERDLDDIPEEIRANITLKSVETIDQVIQIVFGKTKTPCKRITKSTSVVKNVDAPEARV